MAHIYSNGSHYDTATITAKQLAKIKTTDPELWKLIIDIKNGTTV